MSQISKEKITGDASVSLDHHSESVLVIPRDTLFAGDYWQGIKRNDMVFYESLVASCGEFKTRSLMENDPSYKQVIPYMIFEYKNSFFLMQRKASASETRLQSKFSLGIGGHIRQEDMEGKTLFDWASREFHEEVDYKGKLSIESVGVLNDDGNSVGQVHMGFVLLLHGDSDAISIRSEHKQGWLVTRSEGQDYVEFMEPWSQIVWASGILG